MHRCMRACVHVYLHTCFWTLRAWPEPLFDQDRKSTGMYVCMCVCMYVCMYIYTTHIYIDTYLHTYTHFAQDQGPRLTI